jgi:hypothetical protein
MTIPIKTGVVLASFALLAACSSGGGTSAPQAQQGVFGVKAASAAPGGEARVALHTLPSAGSVVTVVGELDYDTSRLRATGCTVNDAAAAGKSLSFAEPSPGMLRTVVVGNLEAIATSSDLLTCTFSVAADAPHGPTVVRVHGDVSDAKFEERPFSVEGTVMIGN